VVKLFPRRGRRRPLYDQIGHKPKTETRSGKLRIGDDWNAITIIALPQNNPPKTMAEFVLTRTPKILPSFVAKSRASII
jgi:hypothetical protein